MLLKVENRQIVTTYEMGGNMDLKKYIVNYASDDSKRTNVASPDKEPAITTVHANLAQANSANKNPPEAN